MNLLIINDYGLEGGGAEIRIKELVERLIETKTFEKIHLLEHSSRNSQSVSIIIHRFNSNIISKTIDIINQNQITHVQVHNLTLFPVQLLASIKKKTSVKIIFFAHDYWAFCGRRNMVSSSQKICLHAKKSRCFLCIGPVSMIHIHNIKKMLNYCDVGIAPSTFVKNIYSDHNILRNKWIIIPPWIDPLLFPFHLSSTLKNTLLFVGPLIPAK